MDWRPPGFSVLRLSQTGILDWVAMSSSRGSSQLRDQTHVTAWAGRFFTTEPPEKPHNTCVWCIGYMYTYICLFWTPLSWAHLSILVPIPHLSITTILQVTLLFRRQILHCYSSSQTWLCFWGAVFLRYSPTYYCFLTRGSLLSWPSLIESCQFSLGHLCLPSTMQVLFLNTKHQLLMLLLLFSCQVAKFLHESVDWSTPGSSVLHCLPEFAQIRGQWVSDAIQPSHPLPSPSVSVFNLSQHQGLFQRVSSSH